MKNQIKKSLSLFMAVMMLLSCWVFVAPDHAKAAATDGQYYVKITVKVAKQCAAADGRLHIWYTEENGTGAPQEKKIGFGEGSFGTKGETKTLFAGYIDGFPTAAGLANQWSGWSLRSLRLENLTMYIGTNADNCTTVAAGGTAADSYGKDNQFSYSWGENDFKISTKIDAPYIKEADKTFDTTTLTLPKLNATTNTTITSTKSVSLHGAFKDQYGVTWVGDTALNGYKKTTILTDTESGEKEFGGISLEQDDGTTLNTATGTMGATTDGTINKLGNVTVALTLDKAFQVSNPQTDGVAELYIKTTYEDAAGNKVSVAIPYVINYQKHSVVFNIKGSLTSTAIPTINYADDTTATINSYSADDFYGVALPKHPLANPDGASLTGHTFLGFFTGVQPTTGVASPYTPVKGAATPTSTDNFNSYVEALRANIQDEEEKAAVGADGFVTYNGVLYYNAGREYIERNDRNIDGTEPTFHGWWRANQLAIDFYDINGAYLITETPYYGQNEEDITWPTPQETYVSGSFSYAGFNGTWSTPAGDVIDETDYVFTENLTLTPNYETKEYTDTYTVKFINPAVTTGANLPIGKTEFDYRDNLTSVSGTNYVQTAENALTYPGACNNKFDYTYEFVGWTTRVPANGAYHIMIEEGGFDPDGNAISINDDWIVRTNRNYYAVFQRTVREYVVNFKYMNDFGEETTQQLIVDYNAKLTAPYDKVPFKYAAEGNGYEFKQWNYKKADNSAGSFEYSDFIYLNRDTMNLAATAWNDGVDVVPYIINATYSDPVPTPYDVTFKYLTEDGEEDEYVVQVNHGAEVGIDAVNYLLNNVAYVADNGETVREYKGYWTYEGTTYNITELEAFAPTAHTTFTAVYDETNAYYDVTYIDGEKTESYHTLGGDNLPIWTIEVPSEDGGYVYKEYIPEDYKVTGGTYVFQGWFDEKQTDTTFAATNGTKYTYDSVITADVTLYSQFKYVPDTFKFIFLSYDGKTQLGGLVREYGQELDGLDSIERSAAARPADNVYTYTFIGWDKEVPAFCEGYDMTFTAQYKQTYNYYDIQWFNTEDDLDNVADDEGNIAGLLETTHTTFGGKVYAPPVTLTPPTAETGFVNVTTGWYYKDAEGNEVKFTRGMAMTSTKGYKMYAKYEQVAQAITVVTHVKDTVTEYTIAYGTSAADIVPTPVSGYVDEYRHDAFEGWYTDAARTAPFDIDTTVLTKNISIYAKFTEEIHQLIDNGAYINSEVTRYPTYYEVGKMNVWCECDKDKTTQVINIPILTDTVAPTGTIYLGSWGSWSSTDAVGAAATDGDEVSIYVNDKTDIIITVNDTGDIETTYNPTGEGSGIAQIQGFISTEVFTGENSDAIAASKVLYEDNSQTLNNAVNVVIDVGEYNLQDGETYIAYYYVKDKAALIGDGEGDANVLNAKVRTAKFIYDTTAPEFTVEGANNSNKVAGTPTYCQSATVTGIEANATLTVNGTVIDNSAITWAADGTGTYAITDGNNYLVTVTDRAGNSYSKKFVLSEDHIFTEKTVAATCTADGYIAKTCSICDYVAETETVPALGHEYIEETVAATCEENGYILNTCSRCGDEKIIRNKIAYILQSEFDETIHQYCYRDEAKTIHATKIIDGVEKYCVFLLEDGEIVPAVPVLGHDYPTDAEGNIIYTVTEKATCKNAGSERAICSRCFKEITREIPKDTVNGHKYGAIKTVQATCTQDGYRYRLCKLCNTSITVEELGATGHSYDAANDAHYTVTAAATCAAEGTMTLKCQTCNADILDENGDVITKAIPATGEHNLVAAEENEIYLVAENDNDKYLYIDGDNDGNIDTEEVDGVTYYKAYKTYAATGERDGCITYNCSTCDGEWYKTVEMVESYTVTFYAEDGTTVLTEITKVSGESIVEADVTVPEKEQDESYTYAFSCWTETDGTATYTFPIEVTKNLSLKATYKASTRLYKHIFRTPEEFGGDTYKNVATLIGAYEDERKLSSKPTLAATDTHTYEFEYWTVGGAEATDFTVTGDKTFTAKFKAIPIEYKVYFYNEGKLLQAATVSGGGTAVYTGATPTKAPDAAGHYTFDGWDGTLENIAADTTVYAKYTTEDHSFNEGEVTQAQTCLLPELTKYTCSACGYEKTEQTKEAKGHNPKEAVNEEVDGVHYSVVYCNDCGAELSRTKQSATVTFMNYNGLALYTKSFAINAQIVYEGAAPTKAADAQYTYTFAGWSTDKDAEAEDVISALPLATADVTYYAIYSSTVRTYKVIYLTTDNTVLESYDVLYNGAVPAYTGKTDAATIPVTAFTNSVHYVFSSWSVEAGTTVTGNINIKPVFISVAHTLDSGVATDATCTAPGGLKHSCTAKCGYAYTDYNTTPALGHEWDQGTITTEVDYVNGTPGIRTYRCTRAGCTETKTEEIPATAYSVKATIKDSNGNPQAGVDVTLLRINADNTTQTVAIKETNNNGFVLFSGLEPGNYRIYVASTGKTYDATVNEDGSVKNGDIVDQPEAEKPADTSCSCSCHRDDFWGTIFRFFQMIIRFFTGRASCCSCPDSRI